MGGKDGFCLGWRRPLLIDLQRRLPDYHNALAPTKGGGRFPPLEPQRQPGGVREPGWIEISFTTLVS